VFLAKGNLKLSVNLSLALRVQVTSYQNQFTRRNLLKVFLALASISLHSVIPFLIYFIYSFPIHHAQQQQHRKNTVYRSFPIALMLLLLLLMQYITQHMHESCHYNMNLSCKFVSNLKE
jgi:O-antigen/teichoic acid export membrane protein